VTDPTNQPATPPPGQPPPGGYPPPPPMPYAGQAPPPVGPHNGLGIAALVIAIVGLLISWIPFFGLFGAVLGVVAIVLGFVGRGRAKRGEANNGGIALAGILLGILAIVVAIAATVISAFFFKEVGGGDYLDCLSQAGNDTSAQRHCVDEFTQHLETKFSVTMTTAR
jgi:Domain of unknown function (DUF4190)